MAASPRCLPGAAGFWLLSLSQDPTSSVCLNETLPLAWPSLRHCATVFSVWSWAVSVVECGKEQPFRIFVSLLAAVVPRASDTAEKAGDLAQPPRRWPSKCEVLPLVPRGGRGKGDPVDTA